MTVPRRIRTDVARRAEVPASGVLIGDKEIAKLFARDPHTIYMWRRKHGFPGGKLPDGTWATTLFAIDDWLRSRGKSRMDRARLALAELSRQERATLFLELADALEQPEVTNLVRKGDKPALDGVS